MGGAEGTRMAEGPCGTEVVSPVEIVFVETGKPEGRGVRMNRRPLWAEGPGRAEDLEDPGRAGRAEGPRKGSRRSRRSCRRQGPEGATGPEKRYFQSSHGSYYAGAFSESSFLNSSVRIGRISKISPTIP